MGNPALVDPSTIRETAAEAWIRGGPILWSYRDLHARAIDDADPRYVGFGVFQYSPRPAAPAGTGAAAPGDDTPSARAWLDLRAEPWVVSVPAGDRFSVLAVHELDTVRAGSIGAPAAGRRAGDHLVAGPDWQGEVPEGIDGVIRTATRLVVVLGRTHPAGPAPDAPDAVVDPERLRLRPLHEYTGTAAPEPAPHPVWPVWREEVPDSVEYFVLLDFLLGFIPVRPAEADLRGRLTDLGIDGRGEFEPAALPLEFRAELERGIADGRARLEAAAQDPDSPAGASGTREQPGADHLRRALGARKGLDGLPAEEARSAGRSRR